MKHLLLITLSILSFFTMASHHPNNGEELCFEHTNVDHGLKYHKDKARAFFPFVNCSGHIVVIDTIINNNGWGKNLYHYGRNIIGDTIYPGERDTIIFMKKWLYSTEPGLYDNSFSIKFKNSEVVQHLNIFCEIDFNYGNLVSTPVELPTVVRGDQIEFIAHVYNKGGDPVTVKKPSLYGISAKAIDLNNYPFKIMPREGVDLKFSLDTEDLFNSYSGSVRFETNQKDPPRGYSSLKIEYYGELISFDHPSIKFDSLQLHKYVDQRGDGRFEFWFENDGDAPLIIEQVKTSCGCLVATYPREPIKAGERNVVKVKYDTNRIGPINKSITVRTNVSSVPVVLRVLGMVKKVEE